MKVLRSTSQKKYECEFGDFNLVSEDGWKISTSFIDFESGLLIVYEHDENEDNWMDTGFGSRTIPNKEYVIDLKTQKILTPDEWSAFFSYEEKEQISEDGTLKLVVMRVYDPKRNSDSIKEKLIELESGKVVSASSKVAFGKNKSENLMERWYRQRKEKEDEERRMKALPTLSEFFKSELKKLRQGDIILLYYNAQFIFKLVYNHNVFELFRSRTAYQYRTKWDSLKYQKYDTFQTIEAFVNKFLKHKNWFLDHSPIQERQNNFQGNQLLKKIIVEYFNSLRKTHDFTLTEYRKIQYWENRFYQQDCVKPNEYKQFCGNCKKPVTYYPRYPKYICSACCSKEITDESGTQLSFSNIGISGGFRITYKKNGKIIKEETDKYEKICFIAGKRFLASEARFGGIIIERCEKEK